MRTWLTKLREQNQLTKTQLSKRMGVSLTAVLAWESQAKSPGREKMLALADILGQEVIDHFAAESRDKTGEVA